MKKITMLKIYLKGFMMGIADVIPGISGGTLAFILGIYERLIHAITQISLTNIKEAFSFLKKKDFKSLHAMAKTLDSYFLIMLFLGVGTSIILLSQIMSHLYETYTSFVIFFFTGLILGSLNIIYKSIPRHSFFNYMFGLGGFLLGISLLYFNPITQLNPSLWVVFLSGFFAVAALFLPGISGSFILLIMGMYAYILSLLSNFFINSVEIIVFLVGALCGMIVISRIIHYLFSRDKGKTLYALLGFVIGSLSIPISIAKPLVNVGNIVYHVGFLVSGILVVLILLYITNEKKDQ